MELVVALRSVGHFGFARRTCELGRDETCGVGRVLHDRLIGDEIIALTHRHDRRRRARRARIDIRLPALGVKLTSLPPNLN